MPQDRLSVVRAPIYALGATFTYTGTAGTSSNIVVPCSGVWVWCTSDAYVILGASVTATTTAWPIPAGQMVWVPNPDGTQGPIRLSAIQVSTGGSAYYIPGL